MDVFDNCAHINDLMTLNNDSDARNELIKLLDYHLQNKLPYSQLLNHLIRKTGLYPYLKSETASWQDRFTFEAFKVDIGEKENVTLHQEQSLVLKYLLDGVNLAVSAPTSFGKSFIIDAFIAFKKPRNVLIIVPTIALTDETRRRLQKKFGGIYKLITTAEVPLSNYNIFIFPQERAIYYSDKIDKLDLLVIDEFYKADYKFDKDRSPALIRAMIKLGAIATQKYYLAPNISKLNTNPFTEDMEFLKLDFNTVFLEKHELYKTINKDEQKKNLTLLNILKNTVGKSLIYAGTHKNVNKVADLLLKENKIAGNDLLNSFSDWLAKNYDKDWNLTSLVKHGTGIHTGRLHRSLSQIQVKLFELDDGLKNIISTSSIIEGVNTSAENVILWSNRNGAPLLNDFTYKNIIGRSGRMFKHFIGNVYILEEPPKSIENQLTLSFPDQLLGDIDEQEFKKQLSNEQIAKIIQYKKDMADLFGEQLFSKLMKENAFLTSNMDLIRHIAFDMHNNQDEWNGLAYLNSSNVDSWDRLLYKIIRLSPGGWDAPYATFVNFIKILSKNWQSSFPSILDELRKKNIDTNQFFQLERTATFKLSALLNDINIIQAALLKNVNVDIAPFISRVSHAFLPSCVYQLEEYGLPRMISKKIHASRLIDLTDKELTLHDAIKVLVNLKDTIETRAIGLDKFDRYILEYFYSGVSIND